jgi:putative transposase
MIIRRPVRISLPFVVRIGNAGSPKLWGASLADAQNTDAQNSISQMEWNEYGTIAYNEWNKLPKRFPNFELDVFQIMPNHMHEIIVLNETVGHIVGAYKSLVANACLEVFKSKNEMMGKLWQRNYYEHIIRNEQSYQTISDYVINNPAKWKDDKFWTKDRV